jgi:hypothetical protein
MSYSYITSLSDQYTLLENVDHGCKTITHDPRVLKFNRGDGILFEGWWEHQGVKQSGYVVRMFAYITGGVHWSLPGVAGAGTSLRKDGSFYIKNSNIPGAGKGVFTTVTIKDGQFITSYAFDSVDKVTLMNSVSDKKLSASGYHCIGIDIRDCSSNNFGSMINRSSTGANNCKFKLKVSRKCVDNQYTCSVRIGIYATKEIVGSKKDPVELYMPYGIGYKIDHSKLSDIDINTEDIIEDDGQDEHLNMDTSVEDNDTNTKILELNNQLMDNSLILRTVKCYRGASK